MTALLFDRTRIMVRGLLLLGLILLTSPFVNAAEVMAAEKPAAEPSAELRSFAQQLVKIMETQDRQALADLIDWEHIYDQSSFGKFEFTSVNGKREFAKGCLETWRDPEKSFYSKYLPKCDLVSLLQLKPVNEKQWAITLRCFVDGESAYLVFYVRTLADKPFQIVDLDWGAKATSLVGGIECGALLAHRQRYIKSMGPMEKFRPWLQENDELFRDFMKACAKSDVAEIIALYPQLDEGIRCMPANEFHYYRAQTLTPNSSLNPKEMQEYYEKNKEPGVLKFLLLFRRFQGDLEGVLKLYDEFDRLVAVDPLNNLHRAELLADLKKFDQAYLLAHKLVKDYPDWDRSQITLMVIALTDKNYQLTLKQIQLLRDKYQLDLSEFIDTDDDYKEFRKSPEYTVWKKENDAATAQEKQ